jgi:hypothetical protein
MHFARGAYADCLDVDVDWFPKMRSFVDYNANFSSNHWQVDARSSTHRGSSANTSSILFIKDLEHRAHAASVGKHTSKSFTNRQRT